MFSEFCVNNLMTDIFAIDFSTFSCLFSNFLLLLISLLEISKIHGGDVKLALILNLHNFLTNLNFTAKNYNNMHLKVLNNFYKKRNVENPNPKNTRGEKAKVL